MEAKYILESEGNRSYEWNIKDFWWFALLVDIQIHGIRVLTLGQALCNVFNL